MAGRSSREQIARYVAPAIFLLAVTIAVLLVRSGLGGGSGTPAATATTRTAPPATTGRTATTATTAATTTVAGSQYYTVQKGDTFGAIAAKEGTTVAAIEELNPGVNSNALQVGQKIRVR